MAKIVSWRGFTLIKVGALSLFCSFAFASDDPYESSNRKIHGFNEYADENFLRPIARIYEDTLPANFRSGVTNFFSNLESINNALNSALQMKMDESLQEITRFCLNTTIGIGGFFDPASRLSINDSDEDFGQTFSVWGANRGPYIVLPFFGPSTIKDAVGSSLDFIVNPSRLYNPSTHQLFFSAMNLANTRAELLQVENVVFGDKYLFYKNAYLQRREFLELDGEVVDTFDDEF
ncbi:VacJ family lipoprotein [Gammaproteobacteria bacterium]|nr:VacJ family lipoprotein [Gammaproteobacteria bacterium]